MPNLPGWIAHNYIYYYYYYYYYLINININKCKKKIKKMKRGIQYILCIIIANSCSC